MIRRRFCLGLILTIVPLSGGCTYYSIKDSATGHEYVTDNWHLAVNPYVGSARFTDLSTGDMVVTQSYVLKQIPDYEAKSMMH